MRIAREIGIDMGHRVTGHAGKCKNLHGHRYRIVAEVRGSLHQEGHQEGMVVDFSFLKDVMMDTIDKYFDHGTALWRLDPLLIHELGPNAEHVCEAAITHGYTAWPTGGWKWGKLVVTAEVPTAENLAKLWFRLIKPGCERYLHDSESYLHSVTVWETPNCYAVYEELPVIREGQLLHVESRHHWSTG